MRILLMLPTLLCVQLLNGCITVEKEDQNTLFLTVTCNPSGATLYENGKNIGSCPTTLNYKISNDVRASGAMTLSGITAVWVSGASSSTSTSLNADLNGGLRKSINLERPRSIAGYEIDANYALSFERNQAMRDQARATAAQAEALRNQSVTVTMDSSRQQSKATSCSSRRIMNTVYTDCD